MRDGAAAGGGSGTYRGLRRAPAGRAARESFPVAGGGVGALVLVLLSLPRLPAAEVNGGHGGVFHFEEG